MNEFDLISRYFAPLAAKPESLGLKDDGALLSVPAGMELVLTTDTLSAGVHFIGDEPPDDIARKALRVNLSDLAAMGARPHGYLLALMLPASTDESWLAAFTEGLRCDQQQYGAALLGGDTTRSNGALSLTITALGLVLKGSALTRANARTGEDIYVSGTIGDAALGLQIARGELKVQGGEYLLSRYRLPQPRTVLGEKLRGIASSCMDISDGLAQDLGHICEASGVGAQILFDAVPLSSAVKSSGLALPALRESVLAGGDDYELLFTAPREKGEKLHVAAQAAGVSVTRIGQITAQKTLHILDADGGKIVLKNKGYSHF